ncbi:MAG: asparagine synthase [Planctomycetes bacterium]|nr:asparagine synthase [Planctomycetota bacterium]
MALPRLTACAGMPLGDPSILAAHALCRAAAADGVRVLLGGEGADELFLGYRRYRALARHVALPWLRPLAPRLANSYAARWLRAAVAADPAASLLAVTPPAFADLVLADAGREATPPAAPAGDRVLAAQAADLAGYLRLDLLPKVDVAGMAAGLETRCPFLDRDVVDLALAAGRKGLGKTLLRAAFPDLPPAVTKLPKRGFALPLDRWFRGDLPWLDLLAEPRTRERPHLRPGGIARAVDLHRAGRADLGHGLYLLVAAETYRRWQDGEIRASAAPGPANGA